MDNLISVLKYLTLQYIYYTYSDQETLPQNPFVRTIDKEGVNGEGVLSFYTNELLLW